MLGGHIEHLVSDDAGATFVRTRTALRSDPTIGEDGVYDPDVAEVGGEPKSPAITRSAPPTTSGGSWAPSCSSRQAVAGALWWRIMRATTDPSALLAVLAEARPAQPARPA